MNLVLDVGDVTQEVVVMADASPVNTTTTTTTQTAGLVAGREVEDGRDFDDLITLNPGTVNFAMGQNETGLSGAGQRFGVSGRRYIESCMS